MGLLPVGHDLGEVHDGEGGHVCEVRAKVGAGPGDPTPAADLVGDVLDDLRPLPANSCAYLDPVRQG